jgi:tRNA threonylcarbamoyladenosine biosynthesis protein TsaB
MSYILHIDTAIHSAYICIALNGNVVVQQSNNEQKDHSHFLHAAIQSMLLQCNLNIKEINAIAISAGPGSYTGLRIAYATAKGLCFSLNIPLIAINTLEIMAATAKNCWINTNNTTQVLFCPMIDARRMEVFSAVYNYDLSILIAPAANLIDENFQQNLHIKHPIIFVGNGAEKFKAISKSSTAIFFDIPYNYMIISNIAFKKYLHASFENIETASPFYIKEFFTTASLYG